MTAPLTPSEDRVVAAIREKDRALRRFLAEQSVTTDVAPAQWLSYLAGIKAVLRNLSNDLGFVATLLVKHYLEQQSAITDFDAAGKAQGAAGVDIEATTADGRTIVGELKTTTPYQPGFGANQKQTIAKDLLRLAASTADHRFMFVIDPDTFAVLCKPAWMACAPGVEIVDLVTGDTLAYPAAPVSSSE